MSLFRYEPDGLPAFRRGYCPPHEATELEIEQLEEFNHDYSYTPQMHNENLSVLRRTANIHLPPKANRTPWLSNGIGAVALEKQDGGYKYSSVCIADDGMDESQGPFGRGYAHGRHFVRQDISVDESRGIKSKTRTYPTLRRFIGLLTSSDAAWSMMYPTFDDHPGWSSKHIKEWLTPPEDLEVITPEMFNSMFPGRHFTLRYLIGVKPVDLGGQ